MPVIQTITASTGGAAGSVTSVAMSVPTGFVVTGSPITTSGTLAVSFASGYSLPTTASQTNWDSAYTFTSTFPTGTALQLLRYNSAGTALEFFTANFLSNPFSALGDTLYSNAAGAPLRLAGNTTATLKFLSQTGDGFGSSAAPIWLEITPTTIGAVPTTRTITINGTALDLSANRTWSVGTVTSVAALTIATTGTDITSSVADGTSTPVITLNVPTASATNRGALSSADWSTFNAKMSNVFTTLGDMVYSNASGAPVRRSGNTTTTKMFLSQTGDGTNSAAPQWSTVTASDTGAVPTTTTITINDVAFDLSGNRSWSVGDFGTW
jgi:hypothetical protein